MKLLLTSAGISNTSIAQALFDLVGKKLAEISLVFVPTASNMEMGDKTWLIDDLINLKKLDLKSIDIADISAVEKSVWLSKFEAADVLYFEGGSTYHLMEWITKSGLQEMLPELLKTKVFVGVSAGSMVACKDLSLKISQIVYEEDLDKTEDMLGLGYVDFYILPHLNSEYFTKVREEHIRESTMGMTEKIYALDDQSAVKVVDGKAEVVSEGRYVEIH